MPHSAAEWVAAGVNGSKVVARFEQMGDSAELVGEFGLLGV